MRELMNVMTQLIATIAERASTDCSVTVLGNTISFTFRRKRYIVTVNEANEFENCIHTPPRELWNAFQ